MTINPRHNARDIFPPTGTEKTAKTWQTEAALRMLMNNLHPDVAENPHELVPTLSAPVVSATGVKIAAAPLPPASPLPPCPCPMMILLKNQAVLAAFMTVA